jgi:hypothetical protein
LEWTPSLSMQKRLHLFSSMCWLGRPVFLMNDWFLYDFLAPGGSLGHQPKLSQAKQSSVMSSGQMVFLRIGREL